MNISLFDYQLDETLIAKYPYQKREESRLLVYNKQERKIEDKFFKDIISYFRSDDILVLNNTKVLKCRLKGEIRNKEGEILITKIYDEHTIGFIGKPAKKMKKGEKFFIDSTNDVYVEILEYIHETDGSIRKGRTSIDVNTLMQKYGHIPLPPYIDREDQEFDENYYQTVYAQKEGSVAAPTAGLHFSEELLSELRKKGVNVVYVTLHVGIGTFRPVSEEDITKHQMHYEEYEVSKDVAELLTQAKRNNKRIIACGTTVVRTLESVYNVEEKFYKAERGLTNIFIYPPYRINSIDGLITNFHLPKSTLLMLVASFLEDLQGDVWRRIYNHAIKERYKFFSYGDAMLILNSV